MFWCVIFVSFILFRKFFSSWAVEIYYSRAVVNKFISQRGRVWQFCVRAPTSFANRFSTNNFTISLYIFGPYSQRFYLLIRIAMQFNELFSISRIHKTCDCFPTIFRKFADWLESHNTELPEVFFFSHALMRQAWDSRFAVNTSRIVFAASRLSCGCLMREKKTKPLEPG